MSSGANKREKARQDAVAVAQDYGRERDVELREGDWYTVVTAAPIYHGRLTAMTPLWIVLDQASWIVETGRLHQYVKAPALTCTEAEYVGRVRIPVGTVMAVYDVAPGEVQTK